jgi:hypothetical protein
LCIGANGIGSKIAGFETGPDVAVQDSGYAVARVAFPRSNIKDGSLASTLLTGVDAQPSFRTYVGDDIHLILFLTADWVAIAFTHAVSASTQHCTSSARLSQLIGAQLLTTMTY